MLEAIEKLLILQDRDRRLIRLRAEVANIEPQRRLVLNRQAAAEQEFEKARQQSLQFESDRKKLELDAEAKRAQIDKYSAQQWQTKKNEEYRALAHEIEMAKEVIRGLEDQQLAIMEQIEAGEKRLQEAAAVLKKAKADCAVQLEQMAETETRVKKQLADAEAARTEFSATVDESTLARYERILKSKGDKVVVGVDRGVCGGCHMRLARQEVVTTQGEKEIVNCPNCGRILYYTRDMDVKVTD